MKMEEAKSVVFWGATLGQKVAPKKLTHRQTKS